MADRIKTTYELKIEWGFQDGDTRTVTYTNPKDNLTSEQIKAVADTFINNKVIIGDKAGAPVTGIVSVHTVETTKTEVDLTIEP